MPPAGQTSQGFTTEDTAIGMLTGGSTTQTVDREPGEHMAIVLQDLSGVSPGVIAIN
jgi:hypothetical protein